MLSVEEILTIVGFIDDISPKDQKSRNQLGELKRYITEHADDEDYVPVDETDSSDEDIDNYPEEVIIDRTDPNYLKIQ
jgi:hypothetical protein